MGCVLMPIELHGPWKKGYAFDLHTLASFHLGVDEYGRDQFRNVRTEMGQLVYDLKYREKLKMATKIVDKLTISLRGMERADLIVPIPPSNPTRKVQAPLEIARELGKRIAVPVGAGVLAKHPGRQLKNVKSTMERQRLLKETMRVSEEYDLTGKNILLLDDLYRSGATLTAATELLYERGARAVVVLTMTKTRTKR